MASFICSRPTSGQTLAAPNYFGRGRIIELTFIHMQLLLNDKLRRSAITCARHALFKQGGLALHSNSAFEGNFPPRQNAKLEEKQIYHRKLWLSVRNSNYCLKLQTWLLFCKTTFAPRRFSIEDKHVSVVERPFIIVPQPEGPCCWHFASGGLIWTL